MEAPAVDQKGSGVIDTTEAEPGRAPAPDPGHAFRAVPLGVLGVLVGLWQSGWERAERLGGRLLDEMGKNGGLSPDPVRKPPPFAVQPWGVLVR